jgi:hypothetical protein
MHPTLALKQERDERCGQEQRGGDLEAPHRHQMAQALTGGAVANLIVILGCDQKAPAGDVMKLSTVPALSVW